MSIKNAETDCTLCNHRFKSVFNVLDEDESALMSSKKSCRIYKKGNEIFQEGTLPYGLFCINSGKVKLTQTGVDGKEQIIHLATNGDVMGFRALLGNDKYSCSAIALEDSTICFIPKEVFLPMVESNPKLAMKVIHLFSDMLKDTENNITAIAQRTVKERIAQGLLLLKERYGFEQDGSVINVTISREEIANIAGTSRETAIRTLFELQKENIIELEGKKIKISDYNALVKASNLFE